MNQVYEYRPTNYRPTALGRYVSPQHRSRFLKDAILKILYDFRTSPLAEEGSFLDRTTIANATSLSPQEVDALCDGLVDEGLIERDAGKNYRLRGKGFEYVMDVPQGPFGPGLL